MHFLPQVLFLTRISKLDSNETVFTNSVCHFENFAVDLLKNVKLQKYYLIAIEIILYRGSKY